MLLNTSPTKHQSDEEPTRSLVWDAMSLMQPEDSSKSLTIGAAGLFPTLATGIAYGILYCYELGSATRLCMPTWFVEVSPSQIVLGATAAAVLAGFVLLVAYLVPAKWFRAWQHLPIGLSLAILLLVASLVITEIWGPGGQPMRPSAIVLILPPRVSAVYTARERK